MSSVFVFDSLLNIAIFFVVLLVVLFIIQSLRSRSQIGKLNRLVEEVSKKDKKRFAKLKSKLKETTEYDDEDIAKFAKRMVVQEKRFFQKIVAIFGRKDYAGLESLGDEFDKVLSAYGLVISKDLAQSTKKIEEEKAAVEAQLQQLHDAFNVVAGKCLVASGQTVDMTTMTPAEIAALINEADLGGGAEVIKIKKKAAKINNELQRHKGDLEKAIDTLNFMFDEYARSFGIKKEQDGRLTIEDIDNFLGRK